MEHLPDLLGNAAISYGCFAQAFKGHPAEHIPRQLLVHCFRKGYWMATKKLADRNLIPQDKSLLEAALERAAQYRQRADEKLYHAALTAVRFLWPW